MDNEQKPAPAQTARLFIALWPSAAFAGALSTRCGVPAADRRVRRVAAHKIHLTLHFLGEVARQRLVVLAHALQVPAPPFELTFSRCEHWPHGLLVALPDGIPPPLSALHGALGQVLRRLGLPADERAFRPHVTLARHHSDALPFSAPSAPPLRWRVHGYALVESLGGPHGGYRVYQRYL